MEKVKIERKTVAWLSHERINEGKCMKKRVKHQSGKVLSVLSFAGLLTLLQACGERFEIRPGNMTDSSCSEDGSPSLSVEFDKFGDGTTWEVLNSGAAPYFEEDTILELWNNNCGSGDVNYKFRIVNNGSGCLKDLGSGVSVLKTTDYTVGTYSGRPEDRISFSISEQPSFPLEAGDSSEFKVRLNSTVGNDCTLVGRGSHAPTYANYAYTYEKFNISLTTNDLTDPTFDASIQVFAGS